MKIAALRECDCVAYYQAKKKYKIFHKEWVCSIRKTQIDGVGLLWGAFKAKNPAYGPGN
jgi:hypothetical protein